MRGNHTLMFPSLSFSLPFPLSKNKRVCTTLHFKSTIYFQPREALTFNEQSSAAHSYSRSVILTVIISKSMLL